VAIPKITYTLDVCLVPLHKKEGKQNNSGLVRALKSMGKIQRIAMQASREDYGLHLTSSWMPMPGFCQ